MQKSIRLLKIWRLCRDKRMMTAPRLAEMCDVDERTIYRPETRYHLNHHHGIKIIAFSLRFHYILKRRNKDDNP